MAPVSQTARNISNDLKSNGKRSLCRPVIPSPSLTDGPHSLSSGYRIQCRIDRDELEISQSLPRPMPVSYRVRASEQPIALGDQNADNASDEQALFLSEIFPTLYAAA